MAAGRPRSEGRHGLKLDTSFGRAALWVGIYLPLVAAPLGAIDPRQAPWYMTAGRVALVLFLLVVVTLLWRTLAH